MKDIIIFTGKIVSDGNSPPYFVCECTSAGFKSNCSQILPSEGINIEGLANLMRLTSWAAAKNIVMQEKAADQANKE